MTDGQGAQQVQTTLGLKTQREDQWGARVGAAQVLFHIPSVESAAGAAAASGASAENPRFLFMRLSERSGANKSLPQ